MRRPYRAIELLTLISAQFPKPPPRITPNWPPENPLGNLYVPLKKKILKCSTLEWRKWRPSLKEVYKGAWVPPLIYPFIKVKLGKKFQKREESHKKEILINKKEILSWRPSWKWFREWRSMVIRISDRRKRIHRYSIKVVKKASKASKVSLATDNLAAPKDSTMALKHNK